MTEIMVMTIIVDDSDDGYDDDDSDGGLWLPGLYVEGRVDGERCGGDGPPAIWRHLPPLGGRHERHINMILGEANNVVFKGTEVI